MKLDISVKYFLNIMIADFIIPAPEKYQPHGTQILK